MFYSLRSGVHIHSFFKENFFFPFSIEISRLSEYYIALMYNSIIKVKRFWLNKNLFGNVGIMLYCNSQTQGRPISAKFYNFLAPFNIIYSKSHCVLILKYNFFFSLRFTYFGEISLRKYDEYGGKKKFVF